VEHQERRALRDKTLFHIPASRRALLGAASLALAIVLPFIWLCAARALTFGSGESEMDCYYHAALADKGPGAFTAKKFPWLTMSVWEDNFADKEMLWHAALWLMRKAQSAAGMSMGPPFHVPALLFSLAALCAFAAAAKSLKIEHVYFYSLALTLACPFYTVRLMMLRPHNAAALFMFLAIPAMLVKNRLWRAALVFALSFFFAWSYSNPHFILLPVCAFALPAFFGGEKWRAAAAPAAAVLGLLAGYTLHPQFPNTLIIWKTQCFDVVFQLMGRDAPVRLGMELLPPTPLHVIINAAAFLVLGAALALLMFLFRGPGKKGPPDDVTALFIMSGVMTFGFFFSKRGMEYAYPYALLFLGAVLRELRRPGMLFERPIYRRTVYYSLWLTFALMAAGVLKWHTEMLPNREHEFSGAAKWVKKRGLERETIGNLIWSDFPQLFHSLPENKFLTALDPMFTYSLHPDKMCSLELFSVRKLKISPGLLEEVTGARYVFAAAGRKKLLEWMKKNGYIPVYEGEDGTLFDLRAPGR
jgi:hypothetical protein